MKCPWQTVEDTYKYRDTMNKVCGYGVKKVITFGDCIKDYCPFYHSEDKRCNRVDASTGRLPIPCINDPNEGTAEEESYWIRQSFSDGGFNYLCSSCKETTVDIGAYCPHCGKKMSTLLRYKDVHGELPYLLDDIN